MMKTTNEEVQNKRSLTKGIIAIACACALALVGVYAYLTATDQVKNIFGFADKLDIEVVEPNWDPANAQNLLPTQTVTKDPALHNPNKADVYVFADVVIPQKDIVTANADGTLNESAVVDLFSYELNDGWTLKDTLAGDDGTVTYRYVYNDVVPAGETSGSIFDQVAIVNYVNEQFNTEELAQQIIINAYGAQAVGFANADEAYASYFAKNEVMLSTLTVNDPTIEADVNYSVIALAPQSVVMTDTATTPEQVVFNDIMLAKDADYAVVEEGHGVEDAIAEFTADEDFISSASSEGVSLGRDERVPFAVYSADDNSLSFYKRSIYPNPNTTFEGKTVTNLYLWVESGSVAWSGIQRDVLTVTVVDEGIKPTKLTGWFNSFENCRSFDLAKLDTSASTSMSSMFQNCFAVEELNLSTFDFSNSKDISQIFFSCQSLNNLDLSNWNVSKVEDMRSCFGYCYSLESLDLSSWDSSSVTRMDAMFSSCFALAVITVSDDWATESVQRSDNMFLDCSSLAGGNGTTYDSSHTDASYARIDGLNGQPGYFTAK